MEKQKTPLKQLLDFCQEGADYRRNVEDCRDITEALDVVIDKIKELLPTERKMVEDANFSGIEYGTYYGNEMADGMATEYFDENYEQ
jgi:hypothetical protein